MRLLKNISRLCATALAILPLFGCEEEEYVKPSALLSESSLTFDAIGAEPQTLTIASDDNWFVDVDSEWITVDPASGSNTVDVTVSVTDNVRNGAMEAPREGTLTIANDRGYSIRTVIYQKGDTYLGVEEYDLTGLAGLEDDTRAKVKETQVVALTSDGFIAADASAFMYILGNAGKVKVGDKVKMNGSSSTTNNVKTFTSDEVTVVSESTVAYPEAKDITGKVGDAKAFEYVKVAGTLINKGLRVGTALNAVTLYNPGIDIESVNMHKVVAYGYALMYANTLYFVPTSFEDGGLDEELSFYPVKYQVRKEPVNFTTASFAAEGKIEPVEGLGFIQYVPFDVENTNDSDKYKLDVSDSSPRVAGPWPGDYWLFYCYGAVKAGSVMHITFETRTSATGHKYWMLEYLDGEVWKPAAEKNTATDVPGGCEYTHAMNADGSTNVQVDAEVTIKKNMENCQFRFRCMANWQANGKGALATRNGGTARLSVTDKESDEFQPKVIMVKEGNGVEIPDTDPIEANIVVSKDLLTFEGTPAGPKKLTVTSDYDFTIEPTEKWLAVSATNGSANEEVELSVTCEPSALSTLREAQIIVKSEESRKVINVVQSAAGQELDSFISVSTGNTMKADYEECTLRLKVQGNVPFESKFDVDWLTFAPQTKALVEWTDVAVMVAANSNLAERVGHITFYNTEYNLETVVTVTQAAYVPPVSGVIFSDNFNWMASYVEYYNAANPSKPLGRSVEDNNASGNAPNAYTDKTIVASGLMKALEERGYVDINASKKVLYPQDCYWKFGKTSNHTGFKLPAIDYSGDATLTFDWSPHMTGSGNIDKVNVVVEIVGSGKVVTSAGLASVSDPFENDWKKGQLGWKNVSATIKGLAPTDRIIIRPEHLTDHDGVTQMRWYLDNIVLKEYVPTVGKTLFDDDFAWMSPLIDEYNKTASKPIGKSVEDNNPSGEAPNAYTKTPSIISAFYDKGYVDIHPEWAVMYPQDTYWKMGKTCDKSVSSNGKYNVTGIVLPDFLSGNPSPSVRVTFNWACHRRVLNAGKENEKKETDPVKVVVEVIRNLDYVTDASRAATYEVVSTSEALATSQPDDKMEWQKASVILEGLAPGMRILVRPENMKPEKSTVNRWYIDNIKVNQVD